MQKATTDTDAFSPSSASPQILGMREPISKEDNETTASQLHTISLGSGAQFGPMPFFVIPISISTLENRTFFCLYDSSVAKETAVGDATTQTLLLHKCDQKDCPFWCIVNDKRNIIHCALHLNKFSDAQPPATEPATKRFPRTPAPTLQESVALPLRDEQKPLSPPAGQDNNAEPVQQKNVSTFSWRGIIHYTSGFALITLLAWVLYAVFMTRGSRPGSPPAVQ